MKRLFATMLIAVGFGLFGLNAQAAVYSTTYSSGFQNGGVIPDGNLSGWNDSHNLTIADSQITSVTVSLNISGGYNGDLYAYLSHGSGFAVLLNRVGVGTINGGDAFGYSASGLNVIFATGGAGGDIHWVPTPTGGGTYAPDGRNISPLSSPSAFDANGTAGLTSFNDLDPSGNWTLFIADASGGGGDPMVVSWTLSITAVPEPVNVALGIFCAGFLAIGVIRSKKKARTASGDSSQTQ